EMLEEVVGFTDVERDIEPGLLRFARAPPAVGGDRTGFVFERQRLDLPIISRRPCNELELAEILFLRVESIAHQIDRRPRIGAPGRPRLARGLARIALLRCGGQRESRE